MKALWLIAALLLVPVAQAASNAELVAASIAAPARSDADRERDAREQPQAVLEFAGFGPGMVVADIFGGGGYYAELVAGVVGPKGLVRLVNNPPYDAYVRKDLDAHLAGNRLPNVRHETVDPADMKLGAASLDGAMIVMSYHDLYVSDAAGGWPPIDASGFIDQIVTALKPGAALLIVDHQAKAGAGSSAAQDLHRIEEDFARKDFAAHGLVYEASLDVLRSKDDDHSKGVMDEAIKGRTDRFVHRYRKPPAGDRAP